MCCEPACFLGWGAAAHSLSLWPQPGQSCARHWAGSLGWVGGEKACGGWGMRREEAGPGPDEEALGPARPPSLCQPEGLGVQMERPGHGPARAAGPAGVIFCLGTHQLP